MAARAPLNPALREQPEMLPTVLNVIEMLRVSSDKQDVARQEYDTAENREQHGLNVLRAIRIKISGTLVMTHAEVQEMITQLSDPNVHGVSVSAIDRLFRPRDYDLEVLKFFDKNRKVIVSTKEGIVEPWTDRGWDICMGAAQKAGAYLRDLKRITSGGRKRARKQKKMTSPTPPYGMVYVSKYERDAEGRCQYLREDTRPVLYAPKTTHIEGLTRAGVVRMVFEWRYVERLRPGTIQAKLNKLGIFTAGKPGQYEPGPWSRQTVRQMLLNRKYIGEHIEDGEVMECPKFVERDAYEAVQRMFKEQKEMSNGKPATKHLLCGWLRCAKCGRRCRTVSSKYPAYICGNYNYKVRKQVCATRQVQCKLIEAVVWDAIWKLLTRPALLVANARAYYESLPSKSTTAKLEKELATVRTRIERTRRMVHSGAEDEGTGTAMILADKRRIAEIETELRAAGSVMNLPPAHLVQAGCNRIATTTATLETFAERRPILEKLVDLKIVYGNGEVEITGKVPVPEMASGRKEPKCNSSLTAACSSVLYIPFKIKERVA